MKNTKLETSFSNITLKIFELNNTLNQLMHPGVEVTLPFASWVIVCQDLTKNIPRTGVLNYGQLKISLRKEDFEKIVVPFYTAADADKKLSGS